jgi:type II secretory pathway component PulL
MKSRPFFLVSPSKTGWRIAKTVGDETRTCEVTGSSTDKLAEALGRLGYRQEAVCLGLPSSMALAVPFDSSGLPRRDRRQALLYRLEEHVPAEAERLTADFIEGPGGRCLGVAVQTDRIRSVVDSLREESIPVQAICPTALLALWSLLKQVDSDADLVTLSLDGEWELVCLQGGRPAQWQHASNEEDLTLYVRSRLLASHDPPSGSKLLVLGDLPTMTAEALRCEVEVTPAVASQDAFTLAAMGARELLQGTRAGWIDVRRGDLSAPAAWAPIAGPAKLALVAFVLLGLVLGGMGLWRSRHYASASRRVRQQQVSLFADLFPGRAVPVSILDALRSEARRCRGVRGADANVPDRLDALATLEDLLAALPQEIRLRITQVRVEPAGFYVEGQTRSHSGAELVTQALRRRGLTPEPPRTESLSRGGVSFTLTGQAGQRSQLARRSDEP